MLELSRDILVRDDADRYFWAVAYRNLYVKVCAIFARAMKLSDNGWRRIRYPFIPVYSIDDATLLKTEFGKKKTFVTFFFRHSSRSNSYRWYTISLPQRVDLINRRPPHSSRIRNYRNRICNLHWFRINRILSHY